MRCLHPLTVSPYKNIKKYIQVPCGRCTNCLKTKRDNLAFRLDAEYNDPETLFTFFVTLTYNDDNLPVVINEFTGEVVNPLSGDDIHVFFKYFRKLGIDYHLRFKYLLTGEYGDLFDRPHYHAIFFVKHFNSRDPLSDFTHLINVAWHRGFVSVQFPKHGFRAFNYVTKYVIKKVGLDLSDSYKEHKPFLRMSNGLGLNIISRYKFDPSSKLLVSDSNDRLHILPRYYLDHIFDDVQKWQHQFYSKMFVTDDFINRCKRYLMNDSQMQEYDWKMRVYDSNVNLRKLGKVSNDVFYNRNIDWI